jgi:hypothetical protein
VGSRPEKGRQKSQLPQKGRQIFSIPQIKFYHYSTAIIMNDELSYNKTSLAIGILIWMLQ